MSKKRKINIVTLGCSKNVVDSEFLMKQLDFDGWEVIHDSDDTSAKVVVINTCGFIADAKEESTDTILRFVNAKNQGVIDRVYVMGCLSQRYRSELQQEIPEVDGFYGVNDLPEILKDLKSKYSLEVANRRILTTPKHYAYLKISEGCNWGCAYCAIPLIRGKYISRTIESLVDEATQLAKDGVKELLIIAQDSTYYGLDIYGKRMLPDLIQKLSEINGIEWIRIHYAYPSNFPLELIHVIKNNPKVCKYIDIPFQHISDNMLKIMRRGIDKRETIELVNKLRDQIPNIAIRTTFLVGHPGESEQDFNELLDFIKTSKFERVGVFTYSEEEGTYAANNHPDAISEEIKNSRLEALMELQQDVSLKNNANKVGQTLKVIVDRFENQYIVGRTEFDSPEVDQEVLIRNDKKMRILIGDFINVRITSCEDYDLLGEIQC
ncbi:MAG: 30S ribosomal protein S12 methylthiotransferase RimO [Bacteroidales bacterium]|nr:MAG: 30S ribosomal protein S12 methylthiotransferase RimO [Bacteroidales bacterium]